MQRLWRRSGATHRARYTRSAGAAAVISPLRVVVRALVIWTVEAAGLFLMLRYLPDVRISDWQSAILAVLLIGLLNALVRPAVLVLAANLGFIPFLIVALLMNG